MGFRDRAPQFEALGVRVFGVSFDDAQKNAAFRAKYGFPYPLLCDTERKLGLAFGACVDASDGYAARFTFVVSPTGVVERAIRTEDPGAQAAALLELLPRD
ncbi:MAG: redoxin domain-containing protein [Planctomycetes bacterium]|nr:redoxin domain-containing protein [Planctomycetota bacterium]